MDKGAWQATVHGMAKSQIQLFTWHTPRKERKPEIIKDMVKTAKYPYGEWKETREMKIMDVKNYSEMCGAVQSEFVFVMLLCECHLSV